MAQCIIKTIISFITLLILSGYALLFNKRILVISSECGNLGNRLFLFSNFIGFAIENNFEVINPTFYKYEDYFELISQEFIPKYPFGRSVFSKVGHAWGAILLKLIHVTSKAVKNMPKNIFFQTFELKANERLNLDREDFLKMIAGKRVVFFDGWLFVDQKNISKHADKIKEYFIPHKKYKDAIESPIKSLAKNCDRVIGVVIRQGDYKFWLDGKYFFNVDVYVQMMRQLENLFSDKKVGFFICSDEQLDTNNFFGFDFIFRAKHDLENRYSLALCDYILSVPSTYSGWAAFYGNVPICILNSQQQVLTLGDFRIINNHMDLRDSTFPSDIDMTDVLITK